MSVNLDPHTIIVKPSGSGRLETRDDDVTSLAASIERSGLLHPLTVEVIPDGYLLRAGHRRLKAILLLHWHRVACRVLPDAAAGNPTVTFAENLHRKQLSPLEEAQQLADVLATVAGGVDEVAELTGRSVQWILNRLDVLDWPEALQAHVHMGHINLAAANRLARIPDPGTRDLRIAQAAEHGCTARTASLWLQDATTPQAPQFESDNFSSTEAAGNQPQPTTTICLMCQEPKLVTDTTTHFVCHPCLSELQRMMNATPNIPEPQAPPFPLQQPSPKRNQ